MPTLTFHGAARTVTGSKYLLEADGAHVLVDCGLFQGLKELRDRNWAPDAVRRQRSLDAVVLTHAHLDHVGYLPRIVKQGYNRPIYCTDATHELAEIILLDSAKMPGARRRSTPTAKASRSTSPRCRCTTAATSSGR